MTLHENIQQAIIDGRWHELSLSDLHDELEYIALIQDWLRKQESVDTVTRELSRLVALEEIIQFRIREIEDYIRNYPKNTPTHV